MNRREWLFGTAAFVVACGPGHQVPADAAPDAATCSATADPQIVFMDPCTDLDPICVPNHSHFLHTLAIPGADVVAGMTKTYPIPGGSHDHMITVTDAHFAMLQAGGSVMIETTIATIAGNDHTHYIQITCG